MERYYITDPDGYYVVWRPETGVYERYNIGTDESPVYVDKVTDLTSEQKAEITNYSSRFGSIANIPAGYTVKIPGILVGTKFRVEELDYEIPVGYDLIDYECGTDLVNNTGENASYQVHDEWGFPHNSAGQILNNSDAYMTVSNRRGFGLEAEKEWSDADFTTAHGEIYTAVFLDGSNDPIAGTVREIESPETTVKYFFKNLESGKTLADYHIREVTVVNPVVKEANADDKIGIVESYDSLTKLNNGDILYGLSVTGKDVNTVPVNDDYTVTYDEGTPKATGEDGTVNVRIDTINNKRKGGVEIYLYKWNTVNDESSADFKDTPLSGGVFKVYRYNSATGKYDDPVGDEYISNSKGNVTVIYGLEAGEKYKVEETISPRGYIGMEKPLYFEVAVSSSGDYTITSWSNDNDAQIAAITPTPANPPDKDDDTDHTDGKNWAEYTTPSNIMAAKIDVYNKPFTLDMKKINGTTKEPLGGVKFSLYKDTIIFGNKKKAFDPIVGYEELVTDANGIIPKIDNTLPPLEGKRYYLTEYETLDGYSLLDEDIIFTVSELGIIHCENDGLLERKEEQVGNTLHVTYTISIPNMVSADYYFDIEKIIFTDKNIHDSDPEQKFVFKVERFENGTTDFTTAPEEVFYVTLNCDKQLQYNSDSDIRFKSDGSKYNYSLYHADDKNEYPYSVFAKTDDVKITKTYQKGAGTTYYSYHAAVWSGRKTVHVHNDGIYRISEVENWPVTDYDFWTGSNVYKGYGKPLRQGQNDGYVIFNVANVSADKFKEPSATIESQTVYRPTASFTNSETEYAYNSSQSWAENIIKFN